MREQDSSHLVAGLAGQGSLRWVVVDLTSALEEARRRLDLSPLAAVALGRVLTGAVLLQRISLKVPSRLRLIVTGDGPMGSLLGEAEKSGNLRGLVKVPQFPTPEQGVSELRAAIGSGVLKVTRESRGRRYESQVDLVSGEIGEDVAHYLRQSEQIRSAVLLGVLPRPNGIVAAGGLIVEALPGTDTDVVKRLEANIGALGGVSTMLEQGGIDNLVRPVLDGFDIESIETQKLAYRCRCSRENLLRKLAGLARHDLESVVDPSGNCEAVCAFCNERYVYSVAELTTIH